MYRRLIGYVERAWDGLAWLVHAVIILLLAAMVAVTATQVFFRYALNQPLTWSEELSRTLFIWIVFLATWAAFRQGLHLGVNAVTGLLPPRGVAAMARVIEAIILAFLVAALSAADRVLTITAAQTSPTLGLPMHVVYAAFPVAAVLMAGEILLGVFTPTEAAVVAVLYAFAVGVFVLRTIHLRDLPAILLESAATTAVVMLMIAAASLYGLIIAREQIPQQAVELITTITGNPVLIIAMMVVLYLLAGMVLDLGANIIILVPVLAPVAAAVGLDPVHFGIITVMALAIGLVTPPVGVCLFVACGISGTPLLQGSKAVLPYLAAILAVLALVIAVPDLALWLPGVVD